MSDIELNSAPGYPRFIYEPVFHENTKESYFELDTRMEMKKVLQLKKKYNDYFKWLDAMDTYNEYMESIASKYGNIDIIYNCIDQGIELDDYIPSIPKLKKKGKNRELLKLKVVPSRKIFNTIYTNMDPVTDIEIENGATISVEDIKDKKLHKLTEKIINKAMIQIRTENIYSGKYVSPYQGRDFSSEYITSLLTKSASDSYSNKSDGESLSKQIKDYFEEEDKEEWEILAEDDTIKYEYSQGRYIDTNRKRQIEITKELYNNGYDVTSSLSQSHDRKEVKLIKRQAGITEPMTKKELKRFKKQAKKSKRLTDRQRDNNEILSEILLGNKRSLDEFVNTDFMNMR